MKDHHLPEFLDQEEEQEGIKSPDKVLRLLASFANSYAKGDENSLVRSALYGEDPEPTEGQQEHS